MNVQRHHSRLSAAAATSTAATAVAATAEAAASTAAAEPMKRKLATDLSRLVSVGDLAS